MAAAKTMLQTARIARGGYGFAAAMEFGCTPAAWSRYETGHRRPPEGLLRQVAAEWDAPAVLLDNPDVGAFVRMTGNRVVDLEAWKREHGLLPCVTWTVEWPDGTRESNGDDGGPTGPGSGAPAMRAA